MVFFFRKRLLCQEKEDVKKYNLVKSKVFVNLRIWGSWDSGFKYNGYLFYFVNGSGQLENEQGMQQSIVRNKYIDKSTLGACKAKAGQSQLGLGILKVEPIFSVIQKNNW